MNTELFWRVALGCAFGGLLGGTVPAPWGLFLAPAAGIVAAYAPFGSRP